ncbi:MAG: DEAD/DEAH box helicase [Candidatus Nanoarchaeia archaeon]|nr:DEAD/DEAH box helicase [Candidatus Nanoarchaeia archaeon]MDD5357761.1 DEAD/DEAH box helicase [Candidatus Nanoarchaeia archaeon]MDD5588680.1 DEAD/DEAH box helicase [Candidatus Nanoarchaeia archaeon]
MQQFEKLGLSKEVLFVLQEAGFKTPSEIQEKAIPLALAGKDIIGGSATGSGKTLAFASAIIENIIPNQTIQALVLTPTRELAEQVASSIRYFSKNKRLNVIAVYGGVNIGPQIRQLYRADVVIGTPGRILDHINRRTMNLNNVKILVLDEVDRMFDMGFSRDVENILHYCPKQRQTMMFSATISPDIDYLAKKHTINAIQVSAEPQVDPKKLKQIYYDVPSEKKFSLFVHLLKKTPGMAMVFCNTRRNVDFVYKNLRNLGVNSVAIHGGLTQNNRTRILGDFQRQNVKVLVCTDVAGRGLDIKGVTYVYNYNMPKISNDYVHRIGRTARAGNEGKVVNLLSCEDYMLFRKIKEDDSFKIEEERLPEFEYVIIKPEFKKSNRGGNFGRRDFSDRKDFQPRRDSGRRDSPRRNFSPRRDNRNWGRR